MNIILLARSNGMNFINSELLQVVTKGAIRIVVKKAIQQEIPSTIKI